MQDVELCTEFEIIFRGDYLHVLLAQNYEITPEGMQKFWSEIQNVCRKYKCYKVLSEGKIHSRKLTGWDAYNSGSQAGEIRGLRIACLFYNYHPDETSDFFKTVAANRGTKVEFFTKKSTALKWLGITE